MPEQPQRFEVLPYVQAIHSPALGRPLVSLSPVQAAQDGAVAVASRPQGHQPLAGRGNIVREGALRVRKGGGAVKCVQLS